MQWLTDFAQWLLDALLWIPRWLWSEVLQALSALINSIPVPDSLGVWTSSIGSLPANVIWFLDLLQFRAGLAMVISALIARWVLRRIPLIG